MLDTKWALLKLHISNNHGNLEEWLNICMQLIYPCHLLDMLFVGIVGLCLSHNSTQTMRWHCITQW